MINQNLLIVWFKYTETSAKGSYYDLQYLALVASPIILKIRAFTRSCRDYPNLRSKIFRKAQIRIYYMQNKLKALAKKHLGLINYWKKLKWLLFLFWLCSWWNFRGESSLNTKHDSSLKLQKSVGDLAIVITYIKCSFYYFRYARSPILVALWLSPTSLQYFLKV